MATNVIIMAVLILLSAFFSATETAFSSLNRTRLKTMADKGNRGAQLTCSLADQYDKLISTILIGNNIVNIATASIGTLLFVELYGDMGATISTVVVTVLVLIFGEITPKSIAKDCPEAFAIFSSPFMKALMVLFVPLTCLFSAWKKLIARLLKLQPNDKMSQEELLTLVDEVQQSGSIDSEEGTLLHNAIEFTDCAAQDILTHRIDLEAADITATHEEIARRFTQTRYSRLLIYRDSIDNILGVIHQKDFYTGTGITDATLEELLSPVLFVSRTVRIRSLLQQMQSEKIHIAVVLDEYGGTYGIVTMEDILEELVGEIWDEHDEVEEPFRFSEDGQSCTVLGSADPEELFEKLGIEDETEASTVSGWVMEKTEKIPQAGDTFTFGGWTATVLKADERYVQELQLNQAV